MLQCQLFNSTYHVSFEYLEGIQSISIDAPHVATDNGVENIATVTGSWADPPGVPPCPYLSFPDKEPGPCRFDPDVLQALSYQSIMDAFLGNLQGVISFDQGEISGQSRILSTALLDTPELSFLKVNPSDLTVSKELAAVLSSYNTTEVRGLVNRLAGTSHQTLQEAIEQMFQNATVSLMSSAALQ